MDQAGIQRMECFPELDCYSVAETMKEKEWGKCYDQAIQANPKNVDAWLNKGKALEELGEFEKANECIDKIYELKKDK